MQKRMMTPEVPMKRESDSLIAQAGDEHGVVLETFAVGALVQAVTARAKGGKAWRLEMVWSACSKGVLVRIVK